MARQEHADKRGGRVDRMRNRRPKIGPPACLKRLTHSYMSNHNVPGGKQASTRPYQPVPPLTRPASTTPCRSEARHTPARWGRPSLCADAPFLRRFHARTLRMAAGSGGGGAGRSGGAGPRGWILAGRAGAGPRPRRDAGRAAVSVCAPSAGLDRIRLVARMQQRPFHPAAEGPPVPAPVFPFRTRRVRADGRRSPPPAGHARHCPLGRRRSRAQPTLHPSACTSERVGRQDETNRQTKTERSRKRKHQKS